MKCARCGREFEAKRRTQKYCSVNCRWGKREKATCANCGVEFVPHGAQKYCSVGCRVARRKAKGAHEGELKADNKCRRCGREYEPQFTGDRFCSDECRWEYYPPVVKAYLCRVWRKDERLW